MPLVNAMHVFGLVVTLTGGGPGTSTYVVSYFIYRQAFGSLPFAYGYASAAAHALLRHGIRPRDQTRASSSAGRRDCGRSTESDVPSRTPHGLGPPPLRASFPGPPGPTSWLCPC
ncbi:hypothetical protein GCM10017687_27730 [Streptomyces echinatus]